MRTRGMALALAATAGLLMAPAPVLAAGALTAAAIEAAYDEAAANREFVRWLSVDAERPAVRSAARSALLSTRPGAIDEFLLTGWDAAIKRHDDKLASNTSFAARMVTRHPAQFYPRVNAAARRALTASFEELQYFVSTGYAEELDLDRRHIADDKARADQVRQDDRDYVTLLSTDDPGAQVRAWAGRAVAPGTTDADVAEFLGYGWVSASKLDLQMYRNKLADNDRAWRLSVKSLFEEAQRAEKEARETVGEAQAQKRAAAARAWGTVDAQTSPARVAWADAEQVALRQAETWLQVSQAAGNATSSNWLTISESALDTRSEWISEQQSASTQASFWIALHNQAVQAEAAMLEPVA